MTSWHGRYTCESKRIVRGLQIHGMFTHQYSEVAGERTCDHLQGKRRWLRRSSVRCREREKGREGFSPASRYSSLPSANKILVSFPNFRHVSVDLRPSWTRYALNLPRRRSILEPLFRRRPPPASAAKKLALWITAYLRSYAPIRSLVTWRYPAKGADRLLPVILISMLLLVTTLSERSHLRFRYLRDLASRQSARISFNRLRSSQQRDMCHTRSTHWAASAALTGGRNLGWINRDRLRPLSRRTRTSGMLAAETVLSYKRGGDAGEDRVRRYLVRNGMCRRWVKRGWRPRPSGGCRACIEVRVMLLCLVTVHIMRRQIA